ncbi:hypothetical protein BDP27DRAFT_1370215 [Rhodocollybia butyracea]|uniref:Uncharacterized protein n=1 Tax=Rhodocollybia butyracea TaxID=206335 RepID=A0A9P5TZW2_9AGAR|nr:hypothetical protein BDP27DRAFT_1370215 [Rhodocollybia butyracea]
MPGPMMAQLNDANDPTSPLHPYQPFNSAQHQPLMSPILPGLPEIFSGDRSQSYSPVLYRQRELSSPIPETLFLTSSSSFPSMPSSVPQTPMMGSMASHTSLPPPSNAPTSIKYIFPAPQPPPAPCAQPLFINVSRALTKSVVIQEFVAVERENQYLCYNVNVLQKENAILKDYLVKMEKYNDSRLGAVMNRIAVLEAEVAAKNTGNGDQRIGGDEEDITEIKDKEVEGGKAELTSENIANLNCILEFVSCLFMKFLGVNDLSTKEVLFGAPVEDTDNMPFIKGTQIRQVWFDWEKGPKTGNCNSLDIIAGYVL